MGLLRGLNWNLLVKFCLNPVLRVLSVDCKRTISISVSHNISRDIIIMVLPLQLNWADDTI